MLDNPAERLWHRVVFPKEFDADYEERILAEARSIAHRRLNERKEIKRPSDAKDWLMLRLLGNPEELMACLFLDNRHRVIAFEILFRGTVDGCPTYARVVARYALVHNAAAVILAHNHPSGDPAPSEADIKVTRELIRAGQLLKLEVLDHLVIGAGETFTSLRELGYFYS